MKQKRLLFLLALLLTAATGAWAQEWLPGITNGDFSGDDVSSFCKKEYPSTDVVPIVIGANVGKDGTPGIVVKSGDDTTNPNAQNYDTQLWIVLPEEIPAGSTIRVQFDYKASKAAKGSTEYHADPASYLTWQAIGDVNFTTEWKTFNGEFTIPKEADGMKSIAFKLQEEKSATDYYFDNFSVSYKKTQWTNIVANSDMEGKDVSCFYIIDEIKGGPFLARINDGIGKDGSRAIKLQSTGNEPNSWDTQFDIRLPYVLPKGTMYRLSFDYKSDKAGVKVSDDEDYSFGFQVSNEPKQYIWWTLEGWPAPYIETTEDNVNKWQHYKKVFAVPADCDGVSKADDNDWLRKFRTIYVNLAGNKVATEFIFDNVKVEILSNVVSTLTPEPVTDPKLMRVYPDPNHQHNFSYKADGATITATCTEGCDIFDPMTLTISAPNNLLFNYQKKEATLNADYNKTAFPGDIAIDYYQGTTKLDGAPFHTGNYSAKVTIGGQTASVDFTINGQTPIRFIKKMKLGNGYAYQVYTLTEYLPVESTNDYCIMLDGRNYIVKGNVVLSKGLIYKGAVNLILCDKAKLTVKGGIWHIGSELNIYAEEGAEQTATIDVQGDTSIELEGIANQPALSGNIVLNSGNLTATPAVGGKLAADDLELTIASGVSGGALTGGTLQDDGSTKFTAAQFNSLTSLKLTTPATNGVKLASDTEDADNWTISDGTSEAKGTATLPNVAEGTTVTATYSGTKRVKSVKAVKKGAAEPAAIINGKFSVSDTKQMYFSKGNLRYVSGAWSFFDNQYDYYATYSADAWDKFGWSNSTNNFGMSTSTNNNDYKNDLVDWGTVPGIGSGWRILTLAEWQYLFSTRSASTVNSVANARYAKGKVNNVYGIILFPDTYTHPDGVTNPVGINDTGNTGWNGNNYNATDWGKMEAAGCVFLPATGYRQGTSVQSVGSSCSYRSSTRASATLVQYIYFESSLLNLETHNSGFYGQCVRLVRDVK